MARTTTYVVVEAMVMAGARAYCAGKLNAHTDTQIDMAQHLAIGASPSFYLIIDLETDYKKNSIIIQ